MPDYRSMGLKYIVVDKRKYDKPLPYKLLLEEETYQVYECNIDVEL